MAKKPPKPWYFKYKEYSEIKKSFVYKPDSDFNISFVNDIIARITNTPTKEGRLYDTFYQLKKFISRGHTFVDYGKDKCCNYINYWLNKTVRDSKFGVDEKNFNYFDEFMQLDPKVQESGIDCIRKLSYMNKDTFEKMKKLYDLYDYYTKLRESDDSSALCHNISSLAEKYESILQVCKDIDENLCNKLRNLKSVIVKDELVAKDKCTKNSFQSIILNIDPPPPPKNPTAPIKVQGRNHVRAPTRPTVSVSSSPPHIRKPAETHTTHSASVSSSRAQGPEKQVLEKQVLEKQVLEGKTQELEEQVRVESERTSSIPLARFPLELPALPLLVPPLEESDPSESSETDEYAKLKGQTESELEPEPELELPQGQLPEEHQGHRLEHYVYPFRQGEGYTFLKEGDQPAGSTMPTFNPEMIMEKMKIAVSKVLETVEPVPVLGVSGAIGALFLLFKYTPIGSLFGRNRRNNQNIPNFFDPRYGEQFSGYYPQYYNEGFPNYRMNIAYHPSSEELD